MRRHALTSGNMLTCAVGENIAHRHGVLTGLPGSLSTFLFQPQNAFITSHISPLSARVAHLYFGPRCDMYLLAPRRSRDWFPS